MPRRIPDFPDSFYSWNLLSSVGSGVTLLSLVVLQVYFKNSCFLQEVLWFVYLWIMNLVITCWFHRLKKCPSICLLTGLFLWKIHFLHSNFHFLILFFLMDIVLRIYLSTEGYVLRSNI